MAVHVRYNSWYISLPYISYFIFINFVRTVKSRHAPTI